LAKSIQELFRGSEERALPSNHAGRIHHQKRNKSMKTTKRFLLAAGVSLALAFTPSVVFAQQTDNSEQREKVATLIRDGVKKNKEAIQRESSSLSLADKETLYNKNRKKGAAGWAALDFGVGFGLGSYIQGDIGFGITQSILDAVGYWVLFAGISMQTGEMEDDEDGVIQIASGSVMLLTSRIMSWIMPFSYQKKQNKNLQEALNYNKYAFSIDPLIVPRKSGTGIPALGLGFNAKF
jgi:hypothetical protein